VWTDLGNGAQLVDDVRRSTIAQVKARHLERWRNTAPSDTMDGAFACTALLDSSREVLTHGSPSQQATFMHIATNSTQCCWQQSADGSSRQVKPLWCDSCDAALTLTHLTECADNTVFRLSQRVAVLTLLSSYAWTQPWLDVRLHLSLSELLLELFPRPPDTPMHLHITRIMCGVFSARQANAALKSIGCTRAQDGRRLMLELRLCCVDGVQIFFQALKNALP
jgi:hypothetical protein